MQGRGVAAHNLAVGIHVPAAGDGSAAGTGAGHPRPTCLRGGRGTPVLGYAADGDGHDARRGRGGSDGAGRDGEGVALAEVAVDRAVDGLDGLPGSGGVLVSVLLARGVVGDDDSLDEHAEGALGVVGRSAGPFHGAGGIGAGVAAGPGAELDLHRRLRVLVGLGFGGLELADDLAAGHPDDAVLRPVDGVGDEAGLGAADGVELAAVVGGGLALAKVV